MRDLGDFEWENPRVPPPPLQFDDAKAAFAAHSSLSMMRSLAVFSLCSIKVSRPTRVYKQATLLHANTETCTRHAEQHDAYKLRTQQCQCCWPDVVASCLQPLVKYADTILRRLKMVFGRTLVNAVIKRTFFLQFCAGKCYKYLCAR